MQKAKSGGTISKAPTGYLNVRRMENGREVRTVIVDTERAPLMKFAFEQYATGEWSVRDLLAEVTRRGLTTTPGPRTPSKVLRSSHFHRLLKHPYYKGLVLYKGVTYPGKHEALVSEETWDRVQYQFEARRKSGEKRRKHNHYLKGTVFCGQCKSRLIVSHNTGRHGAVYPYFICIGRQQKRTDCTQSAVLIETVEGLLEKHYQRIQPTSTLLDQLRTLILDEIAVQKVAAEQENAQQHRRKQQLLDEQAKLLQAHYADAVPLTLMKSEQKRINKELEATEERISATELHFDTVEANLNQALDYASNWAGAYLAANEQVRRQMNQAIFSKVYVDDEEHMTSDFAEPFELLLSPEVTTAARENDQLSIATQQLQEHGQIEKDLQSVYDQWLAEQATALNADDQRELATVGARNEQTPSLARRGLKYDILVGDEGFEPPTLSV